MLMAILFTHRGLVSMQHILSSQRIPVMLQATTETPSNMSMTLAPFKLTHQAAPLDALTIPVLVSKLQMKPLLQASALKTREQSGSTPILNTCPVSKLPMKTPQMVSVESQVCVSPRSISLRTNRQNSGRNVGFLQQSCAIPVNNKVHLRVAIAWSS